MIFFVLFGKNSTDMTQFKTKGSLLSRNLLYKILIFIATVAVIVYFMPRDGKFNYQFDIGKPWKYGQLIATFDFPIYKDAAVVKHEQDSMLRHFQPFFNIDRKAGANALMESIYLHRPCIISDLLYAARATKDFFAENEVGWCEGRVSRQVSIVESYFNNSSLLNDMAERYARLPVEFSSDRFMEQIIRDTEEFYRKNPR